MPCLRAGVSVKLNLFPVAGAILESGKKAAKATELVKTGQPKQDNTQALASLKEEKQNLMLTELGYTIY